MESPMQTRTLLFDDATFEELRAFAAQTLGMFTIPDNMKIETLREKIRTAYPPSPGQDYTIQIVTPKGAESGTLEPPAPEGQPPTAPEGEAIETVAEVEGDDPLVYVTIAEQEGPGGDRPVFLGVNGVGMLVPRGKSSPIRYRYYLVLKGAISFKYHQEDGSDEIIKSEVMNYPHSVDKMPSEEEIQAFYAREAAAAQPV